MRVGIRAAGFKSGRFVSSKSIFIHVLSSRYLPNAAYTRLRHAILYRRLHQQAHDASGYSKFAWSDGNKISN